VMGELDRAGLKRIALITVDAPEQR
jgi:hypothetical protein